MFPSLYREARDLIEEEKYFLLKGRLQFREEQAPTIILSRMESLSQIESTAALERLYIKLDEWQDELVESLMRLLRKYPGAHQVLLFDASCRQTRRVRNAKVALKAELLMSSGRALAQMGLSSADQIKRRNRDRVFGVFNQDTVLWQMHKPQDRFFPRCFV